MEYTLQLRDEKVAENQNFEHLVTFSAKMDTEKILKGFFEGIKRQECPLFLAQCTGRQGKYLGGLEFERGPTYKNNKFVCYDFVLISIKSNDIMILDKAFFKISFDYGKLCLRAVIKFNLFEKKLVDDVWVNNVIDALVEIRIKF